MIALGIVTDGRGEYLEKCVDSIVDVSLGPFADQFMVDDSGDSEYGAWLDDTFPEFRIHHHDRRLGLAAAVGSAWSLAADSDCEFLFHVEEDFVFTTPLALSDMAEVLRRRTHLVQLVLKRQPWSDEEIAAGGQIETDPDAYTEVATNIGTRVEHRKLFSFNPSLIPRRVFGRGWGPVLEADVSAVLFEDPKARSAYWGRKAAPPVCEHIGVERSAGYRW